MDTYTRAQISPITKAAAAAYEPIVRRHIDAQLATHHTTGARITTWNDAIDAEVTDAVTQIITDGLPDIDDLAGRIEHTVDKAHRYAATYATSI